MGAVNDCIFCKIAAGQIKSQVVFEDQRVMAFRDVSPQAPVHILIIPKKHIDRLSAMAEEDLSLVVDIHRTARLLAEQEKLVSSGFRLVTNDGKDSGQTVQHMHFHLLGGRKLSWPPG